jgi:hypothetical protein
MNYSWHADQDPANSLSDPEIETGEIVERIYDEVPDELTHIVDMIRVGKDSCEAGAMLRDLMNKYESRIIAEVRNGKPQR